MCDVLDAIEKKGYDKGDESRAKDVAIKMYQKGIDLIDIADVIGTSTETILEWLNAAEEL